MSQNESPQPEIQSDHTLLTGFILGLLVGAAAALLRLPRAGILASGRSSADRLTLRDALSPAVQVDPIAASIAEGKAAARRRRIEMGLN
ncbi:MAG: hypothetical protein K8I60_17675 [Anaerolineae bacterium]|nr:hypothetical protein [Anaerolineae bacterium]